MWPIQPQYWPGLPHQLDSGDVGRGDVNSLGATCRRGVANWRASFPSCWGGRVSTSGLFLQAMLLWVLQLVCVLLVTCIMLALRGLALESLLLGCGRVDLLPLRRRESAGNAEAAHLWPPPFATCPCLLFPSKVLQLPHFVHHVMQKRHAVGRHINRRGVGGPPPAALP